jgi:hypothetical protein
MSGELHEALPRYGAHDEYILGEIRARYVHGDRDERLRVLAEAYQEKALPFAIAKLAVSDPDPILRRWMAQNATDLDFRERDWGESSRESSREPIYRHPERELWEPL